MVKLAEKIFDALFEREVEAGFNRLVNTALDCFSPVFELSRELHPAYVADVIGYNAEAQLPVSSKKLESFREGLSHIDKTIEENVTRAEETSKQDFDNLKDNLHKEIVHYLTTASDDALHDLNFERVGEQVYARSRKGYNNFYIILERGLEAKVRFLVKERERESPLYRTIRNHLVECVVDDLLTNLGGSLEQLTNDFPLRERETKKPKPRRKRTIPAKEEPTYCEWNPYDKSVLLAVNNRYGHRIIEQGMGSGYLTHFYEAVDNDIFERYQDLCKAIGIDPSLRTLPEEAKLARNNVRIARALKDHLSHSWGLPDKETHYYPLLSQVAEKYPSS